MGDDFRRLEAAYRSGQISRRAFLRHAMALGVVVPALAYLPDANAGDTPPTAEPSEPGPEPLRPTDPPEPPTPPGGPALSGVSPLAGAVAGGYTVTITGARFAPGASVTFGSAPAPSVTFESPTRLHAVVPAAAAAGSVTVAVVNPDGRGAALQGGFTYMDVNPSAAAQVLGIAPLAVIEGTESEIVIRGRNLVRAYNEGFFALRGPARAQISVISVATSTDEPTGTEALTVLVRVAASPALAPQERLNIQVLASTRAAAANDGVVESSSQMFTVLPQAIPVPLAYTAGFSPDEPNLVVVAGRNLAGCSLDAGEGATVHVQQSDDVTVMGIVSFEGGGKGGAREVRLRDPSGLEVGRYALAALAGAPPLAAPPDPGEPFERGEPAAELAGQLDLALTPVPEQRFAGPTASDSVTVGLREGQAMLNLPFNWANFEITIVSITIILPIINEVRLVPFFDGGGAVIRSPVVAQVGKLLRVRGMGLLLALRVEIVIQIEVVLIIGFIFEIWPYGLYNEFYGSYGWAIGSVVIGIRIEIIIVVNVAWMAAVVLPNGQLRVLAGGTLRIGIDFTISADGRRLYFDPNFIYEPRLIWIRSLQEPAQCGQFELAADGGETVFPDAYGGYQSFYFPRAAGPCCVPWEFNMELLRFAPGGQSGTTVQARFRTSFCLTAFAAPALSTIIITSEPPPTGLPPTLVMEIADTAELKALAQPVDEQGNPTGPAQDIRDLGYGVEFLLEQPPDVLDPVSLPDGAAFAVQEGDNVISAAIAVEPAGGGALFGFWPGAVIGFDIIRFLAEGGGPRVRVVGLPVQVNPTPGPIRFEAVLAYRRESDQQLVAVPVEGGRPILERVEPFEPQRDYLLAVRVLNPRELRRIQTITIQVQSASMLLERNGQRLATREPLAGITRAGGRQQVRELQRFFSGALTAVGAEGSVTVRPNQPADLLVEVSGLTIRPHHVEAPGQGGQIELVPPGRGPKQRDVAVWLQLQATRDGQRIVMQQAQPKLLVRNGERFEEYLRVMGHVQSTLDPGQVRLRELREFAPAFGAELGARGLDEAFLEEQGRKLWKLACGLVQGPNGNDGITDDRPLYYVRLLCIGAMRAHYWRSTNGAAELPDAALRAFERPSRGLEPYGSMRFDGVPAGARKAIIAGYDPFELLSVDNLTAADELPDRSNPSGLAALALDGTRQGDGAAAAQVRGAIFPLRYADFDEGIVELAVLEQLSSLVLIMTASQGRNYGSAARDYYDVDRFASKDRLRTYDNDNRLGPSPQYIADGSALAQYIENTLPYEPVIGDRGLRSLPGPRSGDTPFVINQAYRVRSVPEYTGVLAPIPPVPLPGQRTTTRVRLPQYPAVWQPIAGRFRPMPLRSEDAAYTRLPDRPATGEVAEDGSGGNFFSNELFYRVASIRSQYNPRLATGHLHIPQLDNVPQDNGDELIRGVTQALAALLDHSFPLGYQRVTFARVRPGQVAQSGVIIFENRTAAPITLTAVELPAPFAVANVSPSLPGTLPVGDQLQLTFTFTPSTVVALSGRALVRAAGGAAVAAVDLFGTGVPPTPVITSFAPMLGITGSQVTIRGENLDDATAVRIGGAPAPFTLVDLATLRATVTAGATNGPIEVDTPRGTAVSSALWRRITRTPPDPNLKG